MNSRWPAVIISVVMIVIIGGGVLLLHSTTKGGAEATPIPHVTKGSNKLQITDEVVGTGAEATSGKSVSVSYTGTLANGTVFDATDKNGGQPFTFQLGGGQVIKGWDEGVVGMKVGGTRKLVIPPSLAYGSRGAGSTVPPNSTLTFVIKLLSVQ